MNLTNDFAHESRVQRDNVVGTFCGSPIVTLDEMEIEGDIIRDIRCKILDGQLSPSPGMAEVLPGEARCNDGVVRRETTAEAVGYDKFHTVEPIEVKGSRVSIAEARQAAQEGKTVYWRPNREECAIIVEEK